MEKYFIITNSDGDTYVDTVTKDELIKRLEENYYGNVDFLTSAPKNYTNYWGDGVLIIKGEVVTPNPVEVVTKFNIE
jgi:hypothetical protein